MFEIFREKFFGKTLPRGEAFRLFKEVLEGHNRGLEIIADMGEKLGGEFLFDVNYIRPAYDSLNKAVTDCVQKFDLLTRGKYPVLGQVCGRIDSHVRDAIEKIEHVSGRLVILHEDITWENAGEAGGKNANIAEVRNLVRLKTPEGFAITIKAFEELLIHNGLEKAVIDLESRDDPSAHELEYLRDKVLESELPPRLLSDIEAALARMWKGSPAGFSMAVRSSALGEDADYHSYAGIFESVLGVPAAPESVARAYKKVLASLFTEKVFAYRKSRGIAAHLRMAACCMTMVDAVASGVAYSANPSGKHETIVSSNWGLGLPVVEGSVDPDQFSVARVENGGLAITARHLGDKAFSVEMADGVGTAKTEVPPAKKSVPSLADEKVIEIASAALRMEGYFRRPQDIEWALGKDGELYILQARPLKIKEKGSFETPGQALTDAAVLMEGQGQVVQGGAAAGPVFIVRRNADIALIPAGAVVVSKTDTPDLVQAIARVSAIITGTGSPTSHMASLCREFRVPAVVGAGDWVKELIPGEAVTLDAGEICRLYRGVIKEVLERTGRDTEEMESLHEYRERRRALKYISPLNLVDPLMDDFSPDKCRTMHDILRFVHEKSVAELVEIAAAGARRGEKTVRLELSIPAGIIVMDIGGGLSDDAKGKAGLKAVTSAPLKAVLIGMTRPGLWSSDILPLKVGDFLSSMVRMPEIADGASHTDLNLAVASRDYVNLSMRFGYHFNMLDCHMGQSARDNHIYFRFSGGATDISKRSRRIKLLSVILEEYGLKTTAKGDLIIARVSGLPADEVQKTLEMLGMLISYARQLDAVLTSDDDIEKHEKEFLRKLPPLAPIPRD